MIFTMEYRSPLGKILLAADEVGLKGLWFENQKYFAAGMGENFCEERTPILTMGEKWLDVYFRGEKPDFFPPLHPAGSAFRQEVWKFLLTIPYGHTMTYGQIAEAIASRRGKGISARAVGGAVGHNPISLIIPCHRVVGAGGCLTGYAGGLERKIALLKIEGIDTSISPFSGEK